jgi:3-dehydroquinate dehydratase II
MCCTALIARPGWPAWHDKPVDTIALLHGPNLNLLGQREPHIYGTATLEDYVAFTAATAAEYGHEVDAFQTNHEGLLVDAIHSARNTAVAIIINPGAFTHYAWSIHDALAAFAGPVVEVHISNPNAREPWRHTSVIAPVATGSIIGFGMHGYRLAVEAVVAKLSAR